MLILTEKPSVAKDFAKTLNCAFHNGYYENSSYIITNCIGHLFSLEEPKHYCDERYVIPEKFDYKINEKTEKQTKLVLNLLKSHKTDNILIATDADREGEIIARECLSKADITDFSRIKRFWVSQALTSEVIKDGIKNALSLEKYDLLSLQGFARQHADWLIGMNFSRYISEIRGQKLACGRVQTAVLKAIFDRNKLIENFVPKKYFLFYGKFNSENNFVKGLYFEKINQDGEKVEFSSFDDDKNYEKLKTLIGKKAVLIDKKTEDKEIFAPQLYNLTALQKEAFTKFCYTAEKTLKITQSLYEELKCVSYPRTPSRVMGSKNVSLCKTTFNLLCKNDEIKSLADISLSNKRVFNDAKLDSHHALIPLAKISENATKEQKNIYDLIFTRFMLCFLPPEKAQKQTYTVSVNEKFFKISGKKILDSGWKKFDNSEKSAFAEDEQSLENVDWENLFLSDIELKEKWTKPPEYFNEASILSFMENPKNLCDEVVEKEKLVGLGTSATRHTFIPILLRNEYIEVQKKNFFVTKKGEEFLEIIQNSSMKNISDIKNTTFWEEQLSENPIEFEKNMKEYVENAISQKFDAKVTFDEILCPLCKKQIRESEKSFFCTGYKDGCKFPSIWKTSFGTKFTKSDVKSLCEGEKTKVKNCKSKAGKDYTASFVLDKNQGYKLVPIFEK